MGRFVDDGGRYARNKEHGDVSQSLTFLTNASAVSLCSSQKNNIRDVGIASALTVGLRHKWAVMDEIERIHLQARISQLIALTRERLR